MPETFRLPSALETSEQATAEKLQQAGGIFYHEEIDDTSKEVKQLVNIMGVDVPTQASVEDITALKNETVLSEVDQDLLRSIAEAYRLRQPLLFEGKPGTGKTFLMKKFAQFVHGKHTPTIELVGTPRTSELEILGHWAPKGLKEAEQNRYQKSLDKLMGEGEEFGALRAKLNQALAPLASQLEQKQIGLAEFHDLFGDITTTYIYEARSIAMSAAQDAGLKSSEAEWEFKQGALLQAYVGNEGRGGILIVDEFNMIPTNYQQIFLQIGGEQGKLSDTINFWGNSGKTQYQRGSDTWICFASNFPETTPGRSEVVAPMTDRLVWKVIPEEASDKKKAVITQTAGGRLKKRAEALGQVKAESVRIPISEQIAWAEVGNQELGEHIADIVSIFDQEFTATYGQLGDKLNIKGEKRERSQKLEFSARNAMRLFSYLDHFQVRHKKSGQADFAATLTNGFEQYYISRLADHDAREKARLIYREILDGDTGKIKFRGKEDMIMTRREALARLVKENTTTTPEQKGLAEREERERAQHALEQATFAREDALDATLKNVNIPTSIKDRLRAIKDSLK